MLLQVVYSIQRQMVLLVNAVLSNESLTVSNLYFHNERDWRRSTALIENPVRIPIEMNRPPKILSMSQNSY